MDGAIRAEPLAIDYFGQLFPSLSMMLVAKYLNLGPADIKVQFGTTVDFVGDNRVIFNIGGNKYRLIVHFAYAYQRALIKFVGTHKEYDKIDPEAV